MLQMLVRIRSAILRRKPAQVSNPTGSVSTSCSADTRWSRLSSKFGLALLCFLLLSTYMFNVSFLMCQPVVQQARGCMMPRQARTGGIDPAGSANSSTLDAGFWIAKLAWSVESERLGRSPGHQQVNSMNPMEISLVEPPT